MESFSIILIFVILFLILGIIWMFNNCIILRNKVKQSKSTIDVYLTQRFDLIPNLVECVRGYKDYEMTTLKAITELREIYNKNDNMENANKLAGAMNTLMYQVEAIPDLKTSEQFIILQKSLTKIESQLQAARRIYNGDVTLYNTAIQSFPTNIMANVLNLQPEELFSVEEYKAQNIKVDI